MTTLTRDDFPHWRVTQDTQGYDARQFMLLTQSRAFPEVKAGQVLSGFWVCAMSGEGCSEPGATDCDHVIAIDEVIESGVAEDWTPEKRERFANDPANLMITHPSWNRSKAAHDPSIRMPTNVRGWVPYLNRRAYVHGLYQIPWAPGEKDHAAFFMNVAEKHRNGIKVGRVHAWFGRHFGMSFL